MYGIAYAPPRAVRGYSFAAFFRAVVVFAFFAFTPLRLVPALAPVALRAFPRA
jgi:hypothetical protein